MKGILTVDELLRGSRYPGRGIILGMSEGGDCAAAYFIMGRSAGSRNRVFELSDGALHTRPFTSDGTGDASLTIYTALMADGERLAVTNGSQTGDVWEGLTLGRPLAESLESWSYEPDAPHFTPRISGVMRRRHDGAAYELSILKRDIAGDGCCRGFFRYEAERGLGRFIHTYHGDGDPLPSFKGEPKPVYIPNGIDDFSDALWNALDGENRVALYVRFVGRDGNVAERLFNARTEGGTI